MKAIAATCLSAAEDSVLPRDEAVSAKGGDAMRRAFVECAAGLYRFILVRVGGIRDAADEILQECCHVAARHRRPPADLDGYPAWFAGIARNLIRRHWRRVRLEQRRRPRENPGLARQLAEHMTREDAPEELLLKEEAVEQLMLAVTALPAADQAVLIDHYFQGRPQAAIAADLNITEKAVEARLYRARNRLRTSLLGGNSHER